MKYQLMLPSEEFVKQAGNYEKALRAFDQSEDFILQEHFQDDVLTAGNFRFRWVCALWYKEWDGSWQAAEEHILFDNEAVEEAALAMCRWALLCSLWDMGIFKGELIPRPRLPGKKAIAKPVKAPHEKETYLPSFIVELGAAKSNNEARRKIKQKGVRLNHQTVERERVSLFAGDLLEVGKKRAFRLVV